MNKLDAIAQLQSLRRQAQDRARLRSRLTIQEYMDKDTADADVAALTMAIKAVRANDNLRPAPWMTALHYLLLTAAMAAIASMFIYAAS